MSKQSGFFDSVENDRLYSAAQISEYLEGIVANGIIPIPSTNLQVLANTITSNSTDEDKRTVLIEPGKAWINGRWFKSDAVEPIVLDASDVTLNRIDRIVLRLNYTDRTFDFITLKGELASNPVAPAITRTNEIIDLCLAEIHISAQQTTITQSSISDTRADTSICGWVTGLIREIDTATLLNQYRTMWEEYYQESTTGFESWFDDLQESLSTVVMLRRYTNYIDTTAENQTQVPIDIPQYDPVIDILEVYVNGILQDKGANYTSTAEVITFTEPLPVAGTRVTKVVYKNVNGEDATTVQEEVEELQNQMATIMKYTYVATGTDDNIAINNLINNFYNGAEQFAGIPADSQFKLEVIGELGITPVVDNSVNYIFKWDRPANSIKKLTVDFAKCSRINASVTGNVVLIDTDAVTINDLYANIVGTGNVYGFLGNENTIEDSIILLTGTNVSGINGTGDIIKSTIQTFASTGYSQALTPQEGLTRVDKCNISSYRATGNTSAYVAAIYLNVATANLVATNNFFPAIAKAGYELSKSIKTTNGKYSLVGNVFGVAKELTAGTGTETGSINLV